MLSALSEVLQGLVFPEGVWFHIIYKGEYGGIQMSIFTEKGEERSSSCSCKEDFKTVFLLKNRKCIITIGIVRW